jgi:methylmalonyl-CoA/ethylmalonyl-CoA epimerase
MALTDIDHVGVLVADLDEARRFVEDTLGLEVDREAELSGLGLRLAFFRCGRAMIELYEVNSPDSPMERLAEGSRVRMDHIAVRVDDIRTTAAELRRGGVRMRDVGAGDEPLRVGPNLNYWTLADSSGGVSYQLIERVEG